MFRGSADRDAGLAAPQPSHRCVAVVVHAVQHALPPSPCPAWLDDRLSDPTSLSDEPLGNGSAILARLSSEALSAVA
ncbi:MAG: hypothetical protein ACYDGY_05865 [Acidimicrobiales bacterium]